MQTETKDHQSPPDYEMEYRSPPAMAAGFTAPNQAQSRDVNDGITYTEVAGTRPGNPQNRTVVRLEDLGNKAEFVDCPYCQQRRQTKVERPGTNNTLLLSIFFGVFVCFACCVPYCAHWYCDTDHYCKECKNQLTHKPWDGETKATPRRGQQVQSQYAANSGQT